MPTFSKTNIDTPDIDPDALTVHLLGPEPDADDLVKAPENVEMPVIDDNVVSEPISEPISEASPVTNETQPIESVDSVSEEADTRDEDEIREIEKMLRSKKSVRAKLQQAKKEENAAKPKKPAKKIDPIVIAAAVVAVALLVVFIAYFAGFFNRNASLGMTIDEFSTKYSKTETFTALSTQGYSFPTLTYANETKADADTTYFYGAVTNTQRYNVVVSGNVYNSDSQIKNLSVNFQLVGNDSFDNICTIYAPYIQTIFPEMSAADVIIYLAELYQSEDIISIKGSYGLSMRIAIQGEYSFFVLDIISSKDADAYKKELAANASL